MPVVRHTTLPTIPHPAPAATVANPTPTPTTIPVTGLDAAVTAGPQPSAPIVAGVATGVTALAARLGTAMRSPSMLELVPGRTTAAVSLPALLKQLATGPDAAVMVDGLVGAIKSSLGIELSPALVSAAKANPDRVLDLLVLSPSQMRTGFQALQAQHQLRGAAPLLKPTVLPSTFRTDKLDELVINRPAGDLTELSPGIGLWRGDIPNPSLSDAAAKNNIVLAEVFDRLATNAGKADSDKFEIQHAGSRFTSLPRFLKALEKDGYIIEAKVTHRVADFFALKTKAPDGSVVDVPMAAVMKTGHQNAAGQEALLPTVHSEWVFSIQAGPNSAEPHLSGNIKWYQGISGTGFFPCDLMRASPWTGGAVADRFDAAASWQAAELCGVMADVVQDVAVAAKLAMAGYGATGVCNDSVAVIQHALSQRATAYPLFMRDDVLLPEIGRRLRDPNRSDNVSLKTLQAAIRALPSDDVANPSSATRALASMPWAPLHAPFAFVEEARTILTG